MGMMTAASDQDYASEMLCDLDEFSFHCPVCGESWCGGNHGDDYDEDDEADERDHIAREETE